MMMDVEFENCIQYGKKEDRSAPTQSVRPPHPPGQGGDNGSHFESSGALSVEFLVDMSTAPALTSKAILASKGVRWIGLGWTGFIAENLILSENRDEIIRHFGDDNYHLGPFALQTLYETRQYSIGLTYSFICSL